MPGVLITEDGDVLSISYGPHDQAYDTPHFVSINEGDLPSGRFDSSSGAPWYAFILRGLSGAEPGVALPHPSRIRPSQLSRGGGGPSAQSQPPPSSSKSSPQARASAQGGKAGVPARASQRGRRLGRKSCPKGQYWSFKQKKCVKSKFR